MDERTLKNIFVSWLIVVVFVVQNNSKFIIDNVLSIKFSTSPKYLGGSYYKVCNENREEADIKDGKSINETIAKEKEYETEGNHVQYG